MIRDRNLREEKEVTKKRIRDRLLREEKEALALEVEIYLEITEERASWLAGLAGGSETMKTAPISHESSLKVNGSATFPDKRRNSAIVTSTKTMVSNSMAFPVKNCDNLVLYCMLCDITTTSQENMQDHLKGKINTKKISKLTQSFPKEVRRMG
ncbi:hypothetical protein D1007_30069 [Hordeum vulgare]|nr:hypothetical protein D1007_30069 [Hordeum vulgare]